MNKGQKRSKAEFDVLGRIRQERDKRGWTDYELAENAGITQSTISTWYSRGIEPGVASIEKICMGLGISLSQFFCQDAESPFTANQSEILDLWNRLSPKQREAVTTMIQSFIS